MNINWRNL